jgi:FkbM family methyltransferase
MQTYYGNLGEDAVLRGLIRRAEWLLQKEIVSSDIPIFYVDIGCADPIVNSNTFFLYELNHSGLLVDPNKELEEKIRAVRPRDTFICTAVSNYIGTSDYYILGSGGEANTIIPEFMEEVVKLPALNLQSTVKVPVTNLDAIMSIAPDEVFLLNIDTEGADYEVISNYSWGKRPTFIIIEDLNLKDNSRDLRILKTLESNGYVLVAGLHVSSIYVLKDSLPGSVLS